MSPYIMVKIPACWAGSKHHQKVRNINYAGVVIGPKGNGIKKIQDNTFTNITLTDVKGNIIEKRYNQKSKYDYTYFKIELQDELIDKSFQEQVNSLNYAVTIIIILFKSAYENNKAYQLLRNWQIEEQKIIKLIEINKQHFPDKSKNELRKNILIQRNRKHSYIHTEEIPIISSIKSTTFNELDNRYESELNIEYTFYNNTLELVLENYCNISDEINSSRELQVITPVEHFKVNVFNGWRRIVSPLAIESILDTSYHKLNKIVSPIPNTFTRKLTSLC